MYVTEIIIKQVVVYVDITTGWLKHRAPTQAASLVVCSKCKKNVLEDIEESNIVNLMVNRTSYIEEWLS